MDKKFTDAVFLIPAPKRFNQEVARKAAECVRRKLASRKMNNGVQLDDVPIEDIIKLLKEIPGGIDGLIRQVEAKMEKLDISELFGIPTAEEMAKKVKSSLANMAGPTFEKIKKALDKATQHVVEVSISQEEEKVVDYVKSRLTSRGYSVTYREGYYDDRPCGGYKSGRLIIDWSHYAEFIGEHKEEK